MESKFLPCPTSEHIRPDPPGLDLALREGFRQIPRVRTLLVSTVAGAIALIGAAAHAAPASDPAFLGIGMDDMPTYCSIGSITPASPAHDAGLQWGDAVVAVDGVSLGSQAGVLPCTLLTNQIVAKRPGEQLMLDVRRGVHRLTVKATLSTRGEVLSRRFVGEPMLRTDLEDLDDGKLSYDLGNRRGRTTIVGWFMLDRCSNCGRVFDKISDELKLRMKGADNAPMVLGVTPKLEMSATSTNARNQLVTATSAARNKLTSFRSSFTSSVPVALADADVFDALALKDSVRISFMVIDCRGVVRFVAPIAPDSDDLDASIDDILAAAEQAEHSRTRRL
jgi:hypothetical protein